jgi:ribosomal silencing factor RsfS
MNTYRIYGEYIQKVYIDIVAPDAEQAQDIAACDTDNAEWTLIDTPNLVIDINETEFLAFGAVQDA